MTEATLQQILQAREDRVAMQRKLLDAHGCPLICFTMNIAGPVKTSPLIERGFREGLACLQDSLPTPVFQHTEYAITGPQAFLCVDMPAVQLKALCTQIEEATPLGRLCDMDVLDTTGQKLQRPSQRCCLVCGKAGRACAAGRVHTVTELQTVTNRILTEHFAKKDAEKVASLAVQSLLDEVDTTPKPGLVDSRNCGSHTDMTRQTFYASARALRPYFLQCVHIGMETAENDPAETFAPLRQAGLAAEKVMYAATGGVNTHKGILYTMGVLCGSVGRLWKVHAPFAALSAITAEAGRLVADSAQQELAAADDSTAGLRLYRQIGLQGVRGEVAKGLPSVTRISLPVYRDLRNRGFSQNDAGAITLLHLIARVQDTNLYHRGGKAGAAWAADSARQLLPRPTMAQIQALDDAFVQKNLSPGGCADLLAVTYFLSYIEEQGG